MESGVLRARTVSGVNMWGETCISEAYSGAYAQDASLRCYETYGELQGHLRGSEGLPTAACCYEATRTATSCSGNYYDLLRRLLRLAAAPATATNCSDYYYDCYELLRAPVEQQQQCSCEATATAKSMRRASVQPCNLAMAMERCGTCMRTAMRCSHGQFLDQVAKQPVGMDGLPCQ